MLILDIVAHTLYGDEEIPDYDYLPRSLFYRYIHIPHTKQDAVIPNAQLERIRKESLGSYILFGRRRALGVDFFRWVVYGCSAHDNHLVDEYNDEAAWCNKIDTADSIRAKTIA